MGKEKENRKESENRNDATVVRISGELKKFLETKKLVPNETWDHEFKRLLNFDAGKTGRRAMQNAGKKKRE